MRKKILLLTICALFGIFSAAEADNYDGRIVKEVQVSCTSDEKLIAMIRTHITIQPGDLFSQEKIRESIRKIYALKRFSQITVEAETADGGVRLSFCPKQINTISKIQITGNKTVSSERIQNTLELRIGNRVPPNGMKELKQRVLKLYRDQGYHQVQLNISTQAEPGSEKIILVVGIQEGSPSKIGSIAFKGQTVVNEKQLIKASKLRSGMRFTLEALEKAEEHVKQDYAERGYREVKFTDRDMKYNYTTGEINLTLTLMEGKPTMIRFEGNTKIAAKKLKTRINVISKKGLQEEILKENVKALTEFYRVEGYPFTNITYRQTEEEDASVITFVIEEGPQVRVEHITVEGNRAFKTKQIKNQMLTTTRGFLSKGLYQEKIFKEDLLAIKAFYRRNGYLDADVVAASREFSPDQSSVAIHLIIEEGIQTRIETIRILGEQDQEALKKIRKRLPFREGDPLNISQVSLGIDHLKDFYANQGYILAEVDVSTQFHDDNSLVAVTFNIDRRQQFFIGKITIQGVIRTKTQFITREIQVKEGDIYNPQKIRETVRRLLQLGFYDSVTFRRLDTKSTNPIQDMLMAVKETSAKTVEFGLGYSTEDEFKGFAEYADKNVLNYGGRGIARVEASIERPKITLQYQQPHLLTQDTSLVVSVFDVFQKDNDSFEFEKRGGRLAIQHNFGKTVSTSAGYFFEMEDPSNVKTDAILSDLDTDLLNIAGLDVRISWDFRDNVVLPKKGGFSQLYLRTAYDLLGTETEFFEIKTQSNWYIPLFMDLIFACSLNGKLIAPIQSSEHVPIYTRYFIGGDNSVRGFDKHAIGPAGTEGNKIGGDRMIRLNAELRFPIYSVLGGVIFYDAGANWLNDEGFESEDLRDAIGAGLRVETPVGPLRIDYGWKLGRQPGESGSKYYITIGSAF